MISWFSGERTIRCIAFLLVVYLTVIPVQVLQAQESPIPSPAPGSALAPAPTAKPYEYDEFPEWMHRVRRFEVVSLGVFPLAFAASGILFDVGRWSGKAVSGSSDAASYAPLFFAPANKPGLTQDDTYAMLGISLGLCISVGIIDLILELSNEETARRKALEP